MMQPLRIGIAFFALVACGVHLAAQADTGAGTSDAQAPAAEEAIALQLGETQSSSEILTKWSVLPFREIVVEDTSLPAQTEVTVVEGEPGLAAVRYRVDYCGCSEVAREFLDEQIVKEPVDRIVRRAPGPEGPSRGLPFGARPLVMMATAYTPYGPDTNGVTATGVAARRGIVAVDPKIIALGSRVYVEGYGYAIAADTGGAIKGKRIDLCVESAAEAEQFGRREVTVYVLP